MKIQIIAKFTGAVIFEHEAEENTIRLTVEAAVKAGANLDRAYLAGANLDGANLAGANLAGASLDGAYLDRAYLAGANLDGANLAHASLDGAYLAGANLDRANLAGANLDGANLDGELLTRAPISLANLQWDILITNNYMRIGCQRHTHAEWSSFGDDDIADMASPSLYFWRTWKTPLLSMCGTYRDADRGDGRVNTTAA